MQISTNESGQHLGINKACFRSKMYNILPSLVTRANFVVFGAVFVFFQVNVSKGFKGSFHCFSNGMFLTKITNSQHESQISNNSSKIYNMHLSINITQFFRQVIYTDSNILIQFTVLSQTLIHMKTYSIFLYIDIIILNQSQIISSAIAPKLYILGNDSRQNYILRPATPLFIVFG